MNIRPLHDRVVVRRVEEEQKTAGGIVLRATPRKNPLAVKSWRLVMVAFSTTVTFARWTLKLATR